MTGYVKKNIFIWALLTACITFAVYTPALKNGFVNWDDNVYVYENHNIRSIDLKFLKWAFTSEVAANWHPLTMLSMAADYGVWGLDPSGYHLTNILFHALNSFLVFVLAARLIEIGKGRNALFAALVTALLFGLHPLHVESVAWISERKDVLCGFFSLLTILSYLRYVSSGKKGSKAACYALCLAFFVLALMSKPMAVTLPGVLLITDFYPLQRGGRIKALIAEKAPFFLLSLVFALLTVYYQQAAGAVHTDKYPLVSRLFVAMHSYVFYLVKMVFPHHLAPFYPFHNKAALTLVNLVSTGLLLLITIVCVRVYRKNKTPLAAWLYYLLTLLPVIGIVKVGGAASADRYAYLPSLGPFIMAGLWAGAVWADLGGGKRLMAAASFAILFLLMINLTIRQTGVWLDSITLWTYEINRIPFVDVAHYHRGIAYGKMGRNQEALSDLDIAIMIVPSDAEAHYNRGTIYYDKGEYELAIKDFTKAIELNTKERTKALNNRGLARFAVGKYQEALDDYNKAIEIDPGDELAYNNRGNAYYKLGEYKKAIQEYSRAIEINPMSWEAYNNRGYVRNLLGERQQAVNDLKRAIYINPEERETHFNLGLVYTDLGQREEALSSIKKAADMGSAEARDYLLKNSRTDKLR